MTTQERTAPSGILIAVLAIAGIVASLAQTLVVPLIGELPAMLATDAIGASWVVTITLLTGAVSTPVAGRLGDMYGKKRVLLLSLAPLVIGSVICALSDALVPMVIGRGIQGLSTGLVPLGIAVLHEVLPREKVGSAIAIMSASMGIGGALGLPIAAAVAQFADWRTLFWATGFAAAVMVVLIWWLLPAPATRSNAARFDGVGALGLALGLVCLLLGLSKGSEWGWTSATTISLLAAAVVVLVLWGWWELRSRTPLVDLRVTARPVVLFTNLASIFVGGAMFAQSLILPQLMQLPVATGYGHGQSMVQMGLWMAPSGFAMFAASPIGARISAARTPKTTLVLGGVVMAIGYAGSALTMNSLVGLLVTSCITSAGVGLAYGAMPAIIMGAVPATEKAAANSFNSLMRSLGTTGASALVGIILAQMTTQVAGHAVPERPGFAIGLLIGCGIAVAAAVIAGFIRLAPRPVSPAASEDAEEERV